MLPRLFAPVSGVDCPCPWFHANSLLLASLLSSRNCLSAGSRRQLSFASPSHFRIRRDFRSKNPLSGFAPKQTKESSALAAHPHSATLPFQACVDLGVMAMKGTPHSIKVQLYWNLTIRSYSVISRILVGEGSYPSAEKLSVSSTTLTDWARINRRISFMSSSFLLPLCVACLAYLIWIVCMMGGKWEYICGFVVIVQFLM